MSNNEKTLQLNPINRTELEEILKDNESINITILSGSPYKLLEQLKDVDTSEISIHTMNEAEISYSVKIGKGTIFLTDKYHYDTETNTLFLYKKI